MSLGEFGITEDGRVGFTHSVSPGGAPGVRSEGNGTHHAVTQGIAVSIGVVGYRLEGSITNFLISNVGNPGLVRPEGSSCHAKSPHGP